VGGISPSLLTGVIVRCGIDRPTYYVATKGTTMRASDNRSNTRK